MSNKIKELREYLGLNKNQFAKFFGMSSGLVNDYESGRTTPGLKIMKKLRETLRNKPGVEYNDKFFFDEDEPVFPHKTKIITPSQDVPLPDRIKNISVYGKIAAGHPITLWDEPIDKILIAHPTLEKLKKDIFGFLCKGESMEPRIKNNDTVITKKINLEEGELPRDRDIIVSVFKNESMPSEGNVKIFDWVNKEKGEFILSSLNTYEKPKYYKMKDIRYMFKVHLVISKVDYAKEKV